MNGLVITQHDQATVSEAIKRGLTVTEAALPRIAYERTLILGPGVEVPWHLLDAAWHWLDRWDAAAPLWRYGVLAADVGTEAERERTQALTLDLRVPLYACELLFLRQSDAAYELLALWIHECSDGADRRLAFLRALARVKPLFLALPRSWLRETPAAPAPTERPKPRSMTRLVHVEIAPGRYVCCKPEEADMYRRRFAASTGRRGR